MFKSEYAANVHGFTCVSMQAPKGHGKAMQSGINVFHVVGRTLGALVVACVLAGCYF